MQILHDNMSLFTTQKMFICISTVLTWARTKPLNPVCLLTISIYPATIYISIRVFISIYFVHYHLPAIHLVSFPSHSSSLVPSHSSSLIPSHSSSLITNHSCSLDCHSSNLIILVSRMRQMFHSQKRSIAEDVHTLILRIT